MAAEKKKIFTKGGSASGEEDTDIKTARVKLVAKVSDTSKKEPVKAEAKKLEIKKDNKKDAKIVSQVKANAKYIKVAPRKVRLVLDQIRSMQAEDAIDRLRFIKKAAVKPIAKLLNSAVANAENNFEIDKKDLFIKTFTADDGPTIKRYRPRAHGRSAPIRKRTSNINLILGVKEGATKKVVAKKSEVKEEVKVVSPEEVKQDRGNTSGTPGTQGPDKGKREKGFMKGFFQRKTG